jgi:hypothetical protein
VRDLFFAPSERLLRDEESLFVFGIAVRARFLREQGNLSSYPSLAVHLAGAPCLGGRSFSSDKKNSAQRLPLAAQFPRVLTHSLAQRLAASPLF